MTRKNAGPVEVVHVVRASYPVTAEQFALAWNGSATSQEAAEKMGLPYKIMLMRLSRYRKAGIRLKRMPRKNARQVDVERINKSIGIGNNFLDYHPQAATVPPHVERVLVLADERTTTSPARGLSVRIHLLDGTADGLRIIERASSTVQLLACPRGQFRDVKARPEFCKPGVYLLTGPAEADGPQRVYVGEGDPALPRLEHHYCKKDFWCCLLLFTSKTDCLHKAHVQFLESRLAALAALGGRCELDNGNTPLPPTLSEADAAEGEAFLDEALLLIRLSGLTFFEKAPSATRQDECLTGQEMTAHGPEGEGESDSGT